MTGRKMQWTVTDLDYVPLQMDDSDSDTGDEAVQQITELTSDSVNPDDPDAVPQPPGDALQAAVDAPQPPDEAPQPPEIYHITAEQRVAPNKAVWSRTPVRRTVPQQQPAPVTRGLASDEAAAASTPADFISLLLDDVMLTEIVRCTNIQIERKRTAYAKETATVDPTSVIEIKALIGLLLHAGANNDNHLTVEEMFSPQHGASMYRSTMCAFRFNFLLRCIQFDDLKTLEERQKTDKLHHLGICLKGSSPTVANITTLDRN